MCSHFTIEGAWPCLPKSTLASVKKLWSLQTSRQTGIERTHDSDTYLILCVRLLHPLCRCIEAVA